MVKRQVCMVEVQSEVPDFLFPLFFFVRGVGGGREGAILSLRRPRIGTSV